MAELLNLIIQYINLIPTNFTLIAILLVLGLLYRRVDQSDKNFKAHVKESEDKFAAGNKKFASTEEEFTKIKEYLSEHFAQLTEEMVDLRRITLKIIVYNDAMDYYERQNAYDEYIGIGGNGFTQRYYNNILGPRIEQHIKEAELNKK